MTLKTWHCCFIIYLLLSSSTATRSANCAGTLNEGFCKRPKIQSLFLYGTAGGRGDRQGDADRMTGCVLCLGRRLRREGEAGCFLMSMLEICQTAPSHNNWVSGVSHFTLLFFHSSFSFFLLPQHFSDSFPNTSSSHLNSVALCSVFVSALAYGSGFGSVTRWFQLLEVRMSDREGICPCKEPIPCTLMHQCWARMKAHQRKPLKYMSSCIKTLPLK